MAQPPGTPYRGKDQYPTLRMAKDVRLAARYDESHRTLYEARNWRVVMVDSNTLAIVRLWGKEPLGVEGLDSIWTFNNPTNQHFTLRVFGWGRFEIYSPSVLTFNPLSAFTWGTTSELTFAGDADIHIYGKMVITTPNCIIKSIWPCPEPNVGALISIKDFPGDSIPGIATYPNEVAYYGKNSNLIFIPDSALKERLYARVNKLFDHFLDDEAFLLNNATAPQFLDQLVRFYGIKGYILDRNIDTTQKECLFGGAIDQGLALDQLLSWLECQYFHYDFNNDVIMVYALDPYLRYRRSMTQKIK
jgi:hypothetical protein